MLIQSIYAGLLEGKLDQQLKQLDVATSFGRDVQPSELATMCETLAQWHETSVAVLSSLQQNISYYKAQCGACGPCTASVVGHEGRRMRLAHALTRAPPRWAEDARSAQAAFTKKVDDTKATLRAQQDAGDTQRSASDVQATLRLARGWGLGGTGNGPASGL